MRVAICYTKKGLHKLTIMESVAEGVKAIGDEPVILNDITDIDKLKTCDVSIQMCESYSGREKLKVQKVFPSDYGHIGAFRATIKEIQEVRKKRRIVIEAPYTQGLRVTKNPQERYYSIGFDGIKNDAHYYNNNSPSDRWEKLGKELVPWREDGGHVLIFGQCEGNTGMKNVPIKDRGPVDRLQNEEFNKLIAEVSQLTERKIIFRYHPNQKHIINTHGVKVRFTKPEGEWCRRQGKQTSIETDLKNCWVTIAIGATNATIESIILGIPSICPDVMSMANEIAEPYLSNIENPRTPDREQWAHDLAYCQWNEAEMALGLPWKHLRPHVYDPPIKPLNYV